MDAQWDSIAMGSKIGLYESVRPCFIDKF